MIDEFPDRRDRLFGREPDIHHLVDRARQPGLTVLVGRPLMGKTWTLTEVARRLLEEGRHLVGYHESTGGESSHLLYAVSNLYARWLEDSTLREQAISMWERHKDGLVPRIGQLVGTLFEKLGGAVAPAGIAGIVRATFDGLSETQKDLVSGGLQIPALPYDQALSLTHLVTKVSGRRVALILDAWEKSPSLRSETGTLEGILKHPDAWEQAHVFLAVRNPEVDSTRINEDAYRRAWDLSRLSRAAEFYELPLMDQANAKERARLVDFVRERIPVAQGQTDGSILRAIDGYPGVLDFWTSGGMRHLGQTWDDLEEEARNAQALRYIDLDNLLSGLSESLRALAARFAFFLRLDVGRWMFFRDLLLEDQPIALVDTLVDSGVLSDEGFPTYGHDTRHVAARRWFIEHYRPLMRRTAKACVETLAARITGVDAENVPYLGALIACSESARKVQPDSGVCCLLDAAGLVFGDTDAIFHHDFDRSYPAVVRHSPRFAPFISLALRNRAFMKRQRGNHEAAIADYTAAIELPESPAASVAEALSDRGIAKNEHGDSDGAVADFNAAITVPNAPAEQVAMSLYNRGVARNRRGDRDGAIADFTSTIELPDAPAKQVATALASRGLVKADRGDRDGAIADFTATIQFPHSPADQVTLALVNRGELMAQRGDYVGAIANFTAGIKLPGAPAEHVTWALINRGRLKDQRGDSTGAIADFTAAIALPGAPTQHVASALFTRSAVKSRRGDSTGAIADLTAAIELPDLPAEQVGRALYNRGRVKEDAVMAMGRSPTSPQRSRYPTHPPTE